MFPSCTKAGKMLRMGDHDTWRLYPPSEVELNDSLAASASGEEAPERLHLFGPQQSP